MNTSRFPREEVHICIVALLVACVIAANDSTVGGVSGWASSYAYWITRISIEAALFLATLYAVEKHLLNKCSHWVTYLSAVVISLIPFVLAITSFDLIIGLPELGLNADSDLTASRLPAFGKELVYLFDNHLALCALLLLPRTLLHEAPATATIEEAPNPLTENLPPHRCGFIEALDPPLTGKIYWIEAQEHYVRITTSAENRMVLLRFTDAIREIQTSEGMRVHRSHWVAFSAFKELVRDGQSLKLKLTSDEFVPVSRSYRQQVEERFQRPGNV